jgi:sulfite exporter TauE/SafE
VIGLALATGFVGSLHCAAMCGPLAAAGRGPSYLLGRLLSYTAIGALMGAIGQHALCRLPVDRVQWVAVGLVAAFALWRAVAALRRPPPPRPVALGRRRPPIWARLLARLPWRNSLALGLATGILPCGMLLPAWTLAMGAGDAPGGAAVMAAFCLGTAPGLVVPMLARRWLRWRLPPAVHAAAWAALALWVVARPLLAAAHVH